MTRFRYFVKYLGALESTLCTYYMYFEYFDLWN